MSHISFAVAEYAGKRKRTRREVFLEKTELVVPWKALLKVIEPFLCALRQKMQIQRSCVRVHAQVDDQMNIYCTGKTGGDHNGRELSSPGAPWSD